MVTYIKSTNYNNMRDLFHREKMLPTHSFLHIIKNCTAISRPITLLVNFTMRAHLTLFLLSGIPITKDLSFRFSYVQFKCQCIQISFTHKLSGRTTNPQTSEHVIYMIGGHVLYISTQSRCIFENVTLTYLALIDAITS